MPRTMICGCGMHRLPRHVVVCKQQLLRKLPIVPYHISLHDSQSIAKRDRYTLWPLVFYILYGFTVASNTTRRWFVFENAIVLLGESSLASIPHVIGERFIHPLGNFSRCLRSNEKLLPSERAGPDSINILSPSQDGYRSPCKPNNLS